MFYEGSSTGGSQILSIGTLSAKAFTSQDCRGCLIWTVSSDVYFTFSTTAATTLAPLMPANTIIPIPTRDLTRIKIYNGGLSTALVNVIWRA
jgi:hypothetical protein